MIAQSRVAPDSPSQSLPSFLGSGLSHSRLRIWLPEPHVTGQVDQSPHAPHPPSTDKNEYQSFVKLIKMSLNVQVNVRVSIIL